MMKAREELNQLLLSKIHEQEVEKTKKPEFEEVTTSYKKRGKKLKFSDNEGKSSANDSVRIKTRKIDHSSDSSEGSPCKRKYKPYEELSGEFKKIKPPTFNCEVEKGEEVEAWLSGMRKYFQIYNYFGKLKARMVVYNLTGKADIWWEDLKRVKNIKEKEVNWRYFKK